MTETNTPKKAFELQKIYHKKTSFDAPNAPSVFLEEWKPSVKLDLKTDASRLSDTTYDVTLEVTCSVTNASGDQTLFTANVVQAGIFDISGYSEQELVTLLGSYCPAQLYPYARLHIGEAATHGGFPQVLLAPVDFDALLEDAVKKAASEAESGESTEA